MSKKYLNYINLNPNSEGNARRIEMLKDILEGGTFLPKTLEYKDIDTTFRDWVRNLKIISDDGVEYPTMALFSNQRFSEYSQSWQYVDDNKNLLLNFKTITRESNPEYGTIQGGLWNIPGDRFYIMDKRKVLDDNGSESYLVLKMKQPMAIDLNYKVSIFTTRYAALNEFNTLVNKHFVSRQCYIQVNGHYIPMVLENIADESQYNINDRQFYSQTYHIKVMGYVITEDDYRVEETPLKVGINMGLPKLLKKKAEVEMDELAYEHVFINGECGVKEVVIPVKTGNKHAVVDINNLECDAEEESHYYYKPLSVSVYFPKCICKAFFQIPSDVNFVVTDMSVEDGIVNTEIYVNDEKMPSMPSKEHPLILRANDEVKINTNKGMHISKKMKISLYGYDPYIVYAETEEELNLLMEEKTEDEYEVIGEE